MRSVRIWPNSGASPRRGAKVVEGLAPELDTLPEAARLPIEVRLGQLADIRARVDRLTGETEAAHRNSEVSLRLAAIQGVGMLTATAVAATTPDGSTFASARDDAAWLGRTPKPHSTGGKPRSGRISRMGNRYIRRLLYLGAMSLIMARRRRGPGVDWLWQKIATKRTRVVAIAVGNRMARTIFALLRDGAMDRPRVSATPPGQRRQGQEPGADIAQDGGGLGAFVAGEVVEEDRVARLQERWFV